MCTLIFDWNITGHHLEYLHHLYTRALQHPENNYIFLVPKAFQEAKKKLFWPFAKNIDIQYLSDKDQKRCDNPNLLWAALVKSLIVRQAVRKNRIDCVWLIMLMAFMPFLPLLLPKKVKISGILYRIYFHEGSPIRGFRLWLEQIRYSLMVKCKSMSRIFVLNDQQATDKLNEIYRTNKFHYLPDPIPEIDNSKVRNIRKELGILGNDVLFLHFGGLDRRKGTLEILKAINMMSAEDLRGKAFVFAGKVKDSIRNDFYALLKQAEQKVRVITFDEFCSYEHLYNLCYSCNYILIPYQNTNQSSGVIGLASYFSKPVIGPEHGLLGQLIKEFHIGGVYHNMSAEGIKEIMCLDRNEFCSTEYAKKHTIDAFNQMFG